MRKRSARVGHLFRRENFGSECGLFLAAILQDFLFSFYGFIVEPMHPLLPNSHPNDKPWEMFTDYP